MKYCFTTEYKNKSFFKNLNPSRFQLDKPKELFWVKLNVG